MLARGDEAGPELDLATDMLGEVALHQARAEAKRIVTEYAGDLDAFTELLDRIDAIDAELHPEPVEVQGDIDVSACSVTTQDHLAA
jgi:hypothetical protein